jgi:hypothetical protein
VDFVIELLVQAFVQVVVELLGDGLLNLGRHGARQVISSRASRYVLGTLAGLGLGAAWGAHLAGGETWPKLFWVSIALGLGAFALAIARADVVRPPSLAVRDLLSPPWKWESERLMGFALINAGLAVGIAITFGASWPPPVPV